MSREPLKETRLLEEIRAGVQVLVEHAERAEAFRVLEVHERFAARLQKCERADQIVALWRRDRPWADVLPDQQRDAVRRRCIRRVADIRKVTVDDGAVWFNEQVDAADMAAKNAAPAAATAKGAARQSGGRR